jgi:hypothetical protein
MSRLQGNFMDAKNIIIIDGVPHFLFNGNSYLERLKNGMSLDLVFEMEDSYINLDEKFEEKVEQKQIQPYKYELFDEEYDYDISINNNRKGKNFIKKIYNRNTKKNKIRQNGYDDKLHFVETNLPSIYDRDRDIEYYPFDIDELHDQYVRDYCDDYYDDYYHNNYDDNYSYDSFNSYNYY